MKTPKLLLLGTLLMLLGMVSSASAICLLADGIGPDELAPYEIGDVICYEIELQAIDCNFTNISIYFFDPNNQPEGLPCANVGQGILIVEGLSLEAGEVFDVNCLDDPNLAYTVQPGDLTDADGNDLIARIATEFTPEGGSEDCDSATATNYVITPQPCIEVTKTVSCEVSKVGDIVTYTYCIHNCGPLELEITSITDTIVSDVDLLAALDAAGCSTLAPDDEAEGGEDECCFTFEYEIQPVDDDGENPLVNEVVVYAVDTTYQQPVQSEPATAEVALVHPSLNLTKSCISENQQVEPGGIAIFEVEVENTGDVCLEVTLVDPCDVDFDCGPFTLYPDDIETCEVAIDVPPDTTAEEIWNSVSATWTICESEGVSEEPPCLLNEETVDANDYCRIGGGATRTPGFWKTHTEFAEHVLLEHCGGLIDLGFVQLTTSEQMCAYFWANKAKNTDGSKRDRLCQARMHAAFHAIAANLNNCVPSGGGIPVSPADIALILGGTDIGAIKALASELAEYNESGDDVMLNDPDASPGSATPQECRGYDQSFADCPPVVPTATGKGRGRK